MRSAEEAVAYAKALHCSGALDRHLRRQHAGRLVPLRRQRLGAAGGIGQARHALRDQEPQLVPLPGAGDRVRGAAADRDAGRRRQDRAGDASSSIPTAARRARCAPRKTRTTTAIFPIRTCCRWRSTRRVDREIRTENAASCQRRRHASEVGLSSHTAVAADSESRNRASLVETSLRVSRDAGSTALAEVTKLAATGSSANSRALNEDGSSTWAVSGKQPRALIAVSAAGSSSELPTVIAVKIREERLFDAMWAGEGGSRRDHREAGPEADLR